MAIYYLSFFLITFWSSYFLFNQSLLHLISSFKMSLHFPPSFLLLSCSCHSSPDHHHHMATPSLKPSWCFTGFQNLAQPPSLAYSQTLKHHSPLQSGWVPNHFHTFSLLQLPQALNAPCFPTWSWYHLFSGPPVGCLVQTTGNYTLAKILLHIWSMVEFNMYSPSQSFMYVFWFIYPR